MEDIGVDGSIILSCIFTDWALGGIDWIYLALDGDSWRALVNTLKKIRVPIKAGNFLTR